MYITLNKQQFEKLTRNANSLVELAVFIVKRNKMVLSLYKHSFRTIKVKYGKYKMRKSGRKIGPSMFKNLPFQENKKLQKTSVNRRKESSSKVSAVKKPNLAYQIFQETKDDLMIRQFFFRVSMYLGPI